jgi:hypothetical protein
MTEVRGASGPECSTTYETNVSVYKLCTLYGIWVALGTYYM